MIDVARIPDRLEDAVAEAEGEQILDGLLAEVMIDAIDLLLFKNLFDLGIERVRRFEIVPEGLFDDHAPPAAVFLAHETRIAELLDDDAEKAWSHREIEQDIALRRMLFVGLRDRIGQTLEGGRIAEV